MQRRQRPIERQRPFARLHVCGLASSVGLVGCGLLRGALATALATAGDVACAACVPRLERERPSHLSHHPRVIARRPRPARPALPRRSRCTPSMLQIAPARLAQARPQRQKRRRSESERVAASAIGGTTRPNRAQEQPHRQHRRHVRRRRGRSRAPRALKYRCSRQVETNSSTVNGPQPEAV